MRPAAPKGCLGLDHEDEAILVERRADDLRVLEGSHEPDLYLLSQDEVEDLLRVPGADAHRDARVALREALEEGGEDVGGDRRRGADDEAPSPAALEGVHLHAPVGERLERSDRVGEKGVARIREPHPAGSADEELGAEVGLEAFEPRGQRGLGDEESLGGAAYALAPCNLHEAPIWFRSTVSILLMRMIETNHCVNT